MLSGAINQGIDYNLYKFRRGPENMKILKQLLVCLGACTGLSMLCLGAKLLNTGYNTHWNLSTVDALIEGVHMLLLIFAGASLCRWQNRGLQANEVGMGVIKHFLRRYGLGFLAVGLLLVVVGLLKEPRQELLNLLHSGVYSPQDTYWTVPLPRLFLAENLVWMYHWVGLWAFALSYCIQKSRIQCRIHPALQKVHSA